MIVLDFFLWGTSIRRGASLAAARLSGLDQLARFRHYTSGKYDNSDDALNGTEDWLDESQMPNHEDNYEGEHYEGARRKHARCLVEAWYSKEHRTLAEIRQDWLMGR